MGYNTKEAKEINSSTTIQQQQLFLTLIVTTRNLVSKPRAQKKLISSLTACPVVADELAQRDKIKTGMP